METNSQDYKTHLEEKYLPGRSFYLNHVFFPKILSRFLDGEIVDLGFGTGVFLDFLKSKNRNFFGIDSNPFLVKELKEKGYNVELDDVTTLDKIDNPIINAICDNVLEHLTESQIESFFEACKKRFVPGGKLMVIVPDEKGYQRDPTHKTFVTKELIQHHCEKLNIKLRDKFYHPVNLKWLGKFLYLNMQVFEIEF